MTSFTPVIFLVSAIQVGLVYVDRPSQALGYALKMGTLTLAAIHRTFPVVVFWSFAHPAIY